jgi:hypothetical protein
VLDSFQVSTDGFESCLGSVRGNLYRGRMSAGGHAQQLVLDNGIPDLAFDRPCDFLLQLDAAGAIALEVDRRAEAQFNHGTLRLEPFAPIDIRRRNTTE